MLLTQEAQGSERWWSDAARKMPSPVTWTVCVCKLERRDGQSGQHAANKTMDPSGRAPIDTIGSECVWLVWKLVCWKFVSSQPSHIARVFPCISGFCWREHQKLIVHCDISDRPIKIF